VKNLMKFANIELCRGLLMAVADQDRLTALSTGDVHVDLSFGAESARPSGDRTSLDQALQDKRVRSLRGRANNSREAEVQKVMWYGARKKWPNTEKLLKRMIMSDEALSTLTSQVATDVHSVASVAGTWWRENKKLWSPWTAAAKNWMKP
jgi:ABC-type proline/glycine betaine transport system substrate-binding protein